MKTLYELAQSVPDNLIDEQLIDTAPVTGDYVYCAIGWCLHECGIADDTIIEMNELEVEDIMDDAGTLLGIPAKEVQHIIEVNDHGYMTGPERQLAVRRILLELI